MADRTQLKVADHNHIADDDPFAELTRIMGFDPRQPARPQAPGVEKVGSANQAAGDDDFDIDLEKELMGEFDAVEDKAPVSQQAAPPRLAHEPAFEAASAPSSDDELAASFEQDFVFDDAADHVHFAAPRTPEPVADIAFDDDFDAAVANSLDVSPLEDDLPIDQEMAASLDQDFQPDRHEAAVARQDAAEAVQSASEAAFDTDFDNAVQISLEDELAFDGHENGSAAEGHHAHAAAAQQISDEDFAGHFDEAMDDVDLDIDPRHDLPLDPEPAVEVAHFTARPEPVVTAEPVVEVAEHAFDDDFETSFRDALSDHAEVPAVEFAGKAAEPFGEVQPSFAQPAPVAPAPLVAAVEPAKPVAAASERSLEDELNALLGAMTARPMPVVKEAAPAPQPVALAAFGYGSHKPAAARDVDWDTGEHGSAQAQQAVHTAGTDLDDLLAGELDRQDFHAEPSVTDHDPSIDFDDEAFDAAFAKGIEMDRETHVAVAAPEASSARPANSPGWLNSTPAEPVPSWSRATPVAAPAQASFAPQPAPLPPQASSAPQAPSAPQAAAEPAYRSEPVVDYSAYVRPTPAQPSFATQPVPAAPQIPATPAYRNEPAVDQLAFNRPAPQSRHHDEMPDVETVDVPERVVALADDLDIPELSFEEDQPAAPAYDDLDAEFSSLLTEMNATDIAPATPTSRSYEDDSYNAGFKMGYDRSETRSEAPAAVPAAASYAAANDYDADDLPGSRPVSRANEHAADELDYDPELDEAMAIPGLAQSEAAKPRSRGLMIAALVGAVAVAGGLGALAFSFGGKGGSEAPVIVKADNAPIKVKPENPGGAVVPNQDNKVYDAVAKGGSAKATEPVQQKLVTNTEEPVDLASKAPQSRVVDLSPDGTDAAAGTNAAANPDASAQANTSQGTQPAAPAPKSEDRIAQVLQDADKGTNTDVVAVAPRKVKTMMVKPDGSLVPREDPAPAAPKVAATEPTDPAPQHVAPAGQSDTQQTGTVAPIADQAADQSSDDQTDAAKPAKPAAKAQSSNTPAKVPVAPPRPSDQPVDIVGEVKPDQVVASVDPAAASGGSWSMQIASQPTVESAQSTYQDLQRRYGSVLAGHTASIVKAEVAGKGTFYRVRVPAQSRNDAIALCTSYKAAGGNCFVSR